MKRLIHLLPVLAALAAMTLSKPALAKGSLDNAIKEISGDIEIYLKEKQQLQISIGNFDGPPGNSSGRKLENLLKDELEARDIEVAPIARWQVRGEFQVDTTEEFARISIQIRLVNSSGVEVSEFRKRAEISIDQLEDVLAIAQPASFDGESAVVETNVNAEVVEPATPVSDPPTATNDSSPADAEQGAAQPVVTEPATPVSDPPAASQNAGTGNPSSPATPVTPTSPPGSTPPADNSSPGTGTAAGGVGQAGGTVELPNAQTRDDRLRASILQGGFHQINPSTIAASSTSPYHVQMKVRRGPQSPYEPINISELGGGLAFCDLQEGDQYSLVVTNTAPHDVGLELSIDGINSLYFSENVAFAEHGKWVIKGTNNNGGQPYSARIDGWYRNPASVYAFQISSEPDAVASSLGFPAKIGTITATFYGAWVGDDVHPLEAKLLAGLGSSKGQQIGTSKGPELGSQSAVVERKFGRFPLASVSIRYINPEPPSNLPFDNSPAGPKN